MGCRQSASSLSSLLIACALVVGCRPVTAETPAVDADPTVPITRSFVLASGEFAELNLELPAGASIVVHTAADAPLKWNVHSHPDGKVVIHAEGIIDDGDLPFAAPSAGGFSYLWENVRVDDVHLDVSFLLPVGASIASWHPET